MNKFCLLEKGHMTHSRSFSKGSLLPRACTLSPLVPLWVDELGDQNDPQLQPQWSGIYLEGDGSILARMRAEKRPLPIVLQPERAFSSLKHRHLTQPPQTAQENTGRILQAECPCLAPEHPLVMTWSSSDHPTMPAVSSST